MGLESIEIPSGFLGHVVDFWPILDDAKRLGFPVNQNAIDELKETLEEVILEINQEIQLLVPDGLKNLAPKRKNLQGFFEFGYKRPPIKIINHLYNTFSSINRQWNDRNIYHTWYRTDFKEFLASRPIIKYDKKTEKEKSRQTLIWKEIQKDDGTIETKWFLRSDFKPSKDQLVRYIEWKHKILLSSEDKVDKRMSKFYKVPMRLDIKTRELKATTGKRALQDLLDSTGDELLRLIIGDKDYEDGSLGERAGIRSIKKVIDNDIPRWQPANDGSVHTTWGIKAASGQLDSRNPNILNCFSKSTEILTKNGWYTFETLPTNLKVAQYKKDKGITFEFPTSYIREQKESLLQIETDEQIYLELTKDHDCLLENRKSNTHYYFKGEDYPEDYRQLQAGICNKEGIKLNKWQVAFLVALQADGSIQKSKRQINPSLSFSFSKERKIDRFRTTLENLEIPFTFREEKEELFVERKQLFTFYIGTQNIPSWIPKEFLETKLFDSWLLQYDSETLNLFADEFLLWDGYKEGRSYFSVIKQNSIWVQTIWALTGNRASLTKQHNGKGCSYYLVIRGLQPHCMTTNRRISEFYYNDFVYCVTVPDGNIITKNKDRIAITGNCSKHTVVGKLFRQVVSCKEDEILCELDKKSYHVALMGYCANDKDYIRFSQIDPHSYFTAYVAGGTLGLPNMNMSDKEIKEICALYKNDPKWGFVRQHISKVIVLGNQLGLGAKKVFINQNDAVVDAITKSRVKPFKNIESIKDLQKMIGELFPKIERFKREIRRVAKNQKFLLNDWGYIQKFWEVTTMKWVEEENNWYEVPGTESEKAIAFLVQSNAFGEIRDKLIQLRDKGFLERYPFVSSIHDSFVFRIPKKLLESFLADVYPILVSPSRKLVKECCPEGLVVGVDVSWGRNFATWHQFKNPNGMREIKI